MRLRSRWCVTVCPKTSPSCSCGPHSLSYRSYFLCLALQCITTHRLVSSYSASALLLVDNSGSMHGNKGKYKEVYDRLSNHFTDLRAIGFHDSLMPQSLVPANFLVSSGGTDLSIPLNQSTEAIKQGCCTMILFTDGMNNMASENQMFQSMLQFYKAVESVDKMWHISYHFITCGDWWCQQTLSALSSLFGLCNRRVEVTVTKVDTYLSTVLTTYTDA
jgi:hypothetical protein